MNVWSVWMSGAIDISSACDMMIFASGWAAIASKRLGAARWKGTTPENVRTTTRVTASARVTATAALPAVPGPALNERRNTTHQQHHKKSEEVLHSVTVCAIPDATANSTQRVYSAQYECQWFCGRCSRG